MNSSSPESINMEFSFGFDDDVFGECKDRSQKGNQPYDAKQCEHMWFLNEDLPLSAKAEDRIHHFLFQADALYHQKKWQEALQVSLGALKITCERNLAVRRMLYESIARCHIQLHQGQLAVDYARKMVEQADSEEQKMTSQSLLASVYKECNNYKEETMCLHRCLHYQPLNVLYWMRLAHAYLAMSTHDDDEETSKTHYAACTTHTHSNDSSQGKDTGRSVCGGDGSIYQRCPKCHRALGGNRTGDVRVDENGDAAVKTSEDVGGGRDGCGDGSDDQVASSLSSVTISDPVDSSQHDSQSRVLKNENGENVRSETEHGQTDDGPHGQLENSYTQEDDIKSTNIQQTSTGEDSSAAERHHQDDASSTEGLPTPSTTLKDCVIDAGVEDVRSPKLCRYFAMCCFIRSSILLSTVELTVFSFAKTKNDQLQKEIEELLSGLQMDPNIIKKVRQLTENEVYNKKGINASDHTSGQERDVKVNGAADNGDDESVLLFEEEFERKWFPWVFLRSGVLTLATVILPC